MKRFISGFITASLIFGVTALASPQAVNIFYNDIKLKVYGQEVDTEGNDPFIMNDRTYVPARYVAEAMGGEVVWNNETNTVEVMRPKDPEPIKVTSDGLIAEYRYDFGGYYVPLNNVVDKYSLIIGESAPDEFAVLFVDNGNETFKAPIRTNNTSYIDLEYYETILVPSFSPMKLTE